MRRTHTFATLGVAPATFADVVAQLRAAGGQEDRFIEENLVALGGVAICPDPELAPPVPAQMRAPLELYDRENRPIRVAAVPETVPLPPPAFVTWRGRQFASCVVTVTADPRVRNSPPHVSKVAYAETSGLPGPDCGFIFDLNVAAAASADAADPAPKARLETDAEGRITGFEIDPETIRTDPASVFAVSAEDRRQWDDVFRAFGVDPERIVIPTPSYLARTIGEGGEGEGYSSPAFRRWREKNGLVHISDLMPEATAAALKEDKCPCADCAKSRAERAGGRAPNVFERLMNGETVKEADLVAYLNAENLTPLGLKVPPKARRIDVITPLGRFSMDASTFTFDRPVTVEPFTFGPEGKSPHPAPETVFPGLVVGVYLNGKPTTVPAGKQTFGAIRDALGLPGEDKVELTVTPFSESAILLEGEGSFTPALGDRFDTRKVGRPREEPSHHDAPKTA